MTLFILQNDDMQHLLDAPEILECPHCGTTAAAVPISVPRFALIMRFQLKEVGIVARCSACNRAIFLLFRVLQLINPISLRSEFEVVNRGVERFETQYLSGAVLDDFNESLICYANSCWNAFAAMCRRCIQSVSESYGADGTTKVQNQLKELEAMGVADEETFKQLHQIILTGHDGAHPHLPALSPERAIILLQLMKDVLYQLYVRPAKIREASELRKKASARGVAGN